MRTLLLAIVSLSLNLSSALAEEVSTYPYCYRGKLTLITGENKDVFLTFSSVQKNVAKVREFKIGHSLKNKSGKIISDGEVAFNENDDYVPGGYATFNIDIHLMFGGNRATGFYKEYHFKQGRGGFGLSNPDSLTIEGTFDLRRCRVEIVDL